MWAIVSNCLDDCFSNSSVFVHRKSGGKRAKAVRVKCVSSSFAYLASSFVFTSRLLFFVDDFQKAKKGVFNRGSFTKPGGWRCKKKRPSVEKEENTVSCLSKLKHVRHNWTDQPKRKKRQPYKCMERQCPRLHLFRLNNGFSNRGGEKWRHYCPKTFGSRISLPN